MVLPIILRALSTTTMYLDPQAHEAITGAPVTIGSIAGSDFKAFGGVLSGTVLGVVRSSLIVQSWRSAKLSRWITTRLRFSFQPEGANARIDLVHLDVPGHGYNGVVEGWEKFYWAPWQQFLTRTSGR